MGKTGLGILRIFALCLLLLCTNAVSGCSNSQCKEAKVEAVQALNEVSDLGTRIDELESEAEVLLRNLCQEIESENPSASDLLDKPFSAAWCQDWRQTGNQPPLPDPELQNNYARVRILEDDQSKSLRRWALTVTTYSDCFDPKEVLDAKELLAK